MSLNSELPMSSNNFSISVSGSGGLLGPVVSEAFKHHPQATIYDRSDRFRNAVGQEQQIAPRMNPADRARVDRAVRNMNKPDESDIKIVFHKSGNLEIVEVIGPKGRSKHTFDWNTTDEKRFDMLLQEIMRSIRVMRHQLFTPGMS